MYMFNTILNPLSQFEIIDFLYFEASLIDNIHISITNIGFYLILSLVFIMILKILTSNLNRLVSNNWSISQESMYVTIHNVVISQINTKKGRKVTGVGEVTSVPETIKLRKRLKALITSKWHKSYWQMNK